jgi:phosphoserine phosphatase
MPTSPATSREDKIPLCVDLDGTLIRTDLLWESLARLLRRNPFQLLPVLFWWMRGRAFLKRQLVRRVTIDPAALPYHEPFLAFLREQKAAGRKLVLVTASDRDMALPVANHTGLFDEVLGSDGKTNLRGTNKLKVLVEKFGERGFDYAGNSSADFAVWRGAREAIVVNASAAVLKRANGSVLDIVISVSTLVCCFPPPIQEIIYITRRTHLQPFRDPLHRHDRLRTQPRR